MVTAFGGIKRKYVDKSIYSGHTNELGLPHGQGVMQYFVATEAASENEVSQAGVYSIYTGSFENGNRHGKGTYNEWTTQANYEGDWEDDLAHGYGLVKWESEGTQFTGKFCEGRLSNGGFTFHSGSYYEGDFSATTGMFEGQGTF